MYYLHIIIPILILIFAILVNIIIVKRHVTAPLKVLASKFKDHESLTTLILEMTPFGCQVFGKDFAILDCNKAVLDIFGFDNKEGYIQKYFELSSEFQPDGQKSDQKFKEILSKSFASGREVFEWTFRKLDGSMIQTEITLVRVTSSDDATSVIAYINDLRRTDEILSRITHLENVTDKIYYDPLTGVYNKKYFEEVTKQHINTLSRSDGRISLLKVNIDNFKLYSDTYGYIKGDEVLKAVAIATSNIITRTDDFVTRISSGELTVVLPNTNEGGARFIAHKILEAVRELNIPHSKSEHSEFVTVSIGITSGKAIHIQSSANYIKRADEMLLKAKQNGRDQYAYGSLNG